jgi:hypothetical protein
MTTKSRTNSQARNEYNAAFRAIRQCNGYESVYHNMVCDKGIDFNAAAKASASFRDRESSQYDVFGIMRNQRRVSLAKLHNAGDAEWYRKNVLKGFARAARRAYRTRLVNEPITGFNGSIPF